MGPRRSSAQGQGSATQDGGEDRLRAVGSEWRRGGWVPWAPGCFAVWYSFIGGEIRPTGRVFDVKDYRKISICRSSERGEWKLGYWFDSRATLEWSRESGHGVWPRWAGSWPPESVYELEQGNRNWGMQLLWSPGNAITGVNCAPSALGSFGSNTAPW